MRMGERIEGTAAGACSPATGFEPAVPDQLANAGRLDRAAAAKAYSALQSKLDELIFVRKRLGNDADNYIIYLLIAAANHGSQLKSMVSEVAHGGFTNPAGGVNALSISEITGIPRETVRRKLKWLAEAKFVVQDKYKLYFLNPKYNLDDSGRG